MDVSLITATFNTEDTLLHCLQSVGEQTVDPEHLIIDGVSTDKTLEIAKTYTSHTVSVISEPDRGIYDAMNKGIARARGDIIGILNADDFYADSEVLKDVANIFLDESVDVCYGDLCYVDGRDPSKVVRFWKSGEYRLKGFYWGWMPPHPTFFVRRTVYEKYGVFNLAMGSAADYELMLRFLVKHQLNARYIPRVLVKMRTGGVSNISLKNRMAANRMDRKAWLVNNLRPYPWTLACKPLRKLFQWVRKPPTVAIT